MGALAGLFAKPLVKVGAAILAVLAIAFAVWRVLDRQYTRGETSGKAAVTGAVQADTIKRTDEARQDKEQSNEKARANPVDDLIDRMR